MKWTRTGEVLSIRQSSSPWARLMFKYSERIYIKSVIGSPH
jgi:hypothetical protein